MGPSGCAGGMQIFTWRKFPCCPPWRDRLVTSLQTPGSTGVTMQRAQSLTGARLWLVHPISAEPGTVPDAEDNQCLCDECLCFHAFLNFIFKNTKDVVHPSYTASDPLSSDALSYSKEPRGSIRLFKSTQ